MPHEVLFQVDEHPLGIQLIANHPQDAMLATRRLRVMDYDFIELNCACPSHRIVANGCGAALLLDLPKLLAIAAAIKEGAGDLPVTAKLRLGFHSKELQADRIIPQLAEIGYSWVTVHGRYADQNYDQTADWAAISKLADQSLLPLIGNGDITSASQAYYFLAKSKIVAVMIGRGAFGKPWVFSGMEELNWMERVGWAQKHFGYQLQLYDEREAVIRFRKHLIWYSRGGQKARQLRNSIPGMSSAAQVEEAFAIMAQWQ